MQQHEKLIFEKCSHLSKLNKYCGFIWSRRFDFNLTENKYLCAVLFSPDIRLKNVLLDRER